ncbi:M15 family metallopeptidase [Arthrobacter crystallopoietes]|uniref:M15 family metallopeptidase n=1 Tax=Crystallibacter crystallopoietes TaxID=37928 RepID=UPI003D1ECDCA
MGVINRMFAVLLAVFVCLGLVAPAATAATVNGYEIDEVSSLQVVVNKHRKLNPQSYVPSRMVRIQGQSLRAEAADAYKKFASAAKKAGVSIVPVSGYRSYNQQASLYNNYVLQYGQETADTLAARPGYSEHQTGLAMDIGNPGGTCALEPCFANTPAGKWAAEHADDYGFITRYPKGAEATTGYTYEPWHLRYVGTSLVADMNDGGFLTLEDFFRLDAAPDYP